MPLFLETRNQNKNIDDDEWAIIVTQCHKSSFSFHDAWNYKRGGDDNSFIGLQEAIDLCKQYVYLPLDERPYALRIYVWDDDPRVKLDIAVS